MVKRPSLDADEHGRLVEQYWAGADLKRLAASVGLASSYVYLICRGDAPAYHALWLKLPDELTSKVTGPRRGSLSGATSVAMWEAYGDEELAVRDVAARFGVSCSSTTGSGHWCRTPGRTQYDCMTLRDLAERWVAIKNTARPSPNTAAARVSDLWIVGQALANTEHAGEEKLAVLERLSPADVTLSRLEDAFAAYAEGHAASSTRRVMSTWRQFCLWMVRDGHLDANPMDHIEAPARTAWAPKPLQPEDLAAVAEHASAPAATTRNPWPERDEALFALLITGGLRISEIVDLRIGDCYLSDDPTRLRISGKGEKVRTVPIPPEAVARVESYLDSRGAREFPVDADTPLMVRPDGRPMTRSAIDHAVRGWFRRAGRTPPKGALAHSFRHTYATMLIDNGASLPEVQQLLGHADLATTQAYLGVTAKGLADAAMANPARKLL